VTPRNKFASLFKQNLSQSEFKEEDVERPFKLRLLANGMKAVSIEGRVRYMHFLNVTVNETSTSK
jgi:hypothetical protein